MSTSTAAAKPSINLLRGWPSPAHHPTPALLAASTALLTSPASTPALQYAPDEGSRELREALAGWLAEYYSIPSSSSCAPNSPVSNLLSSSSVSAPASRITSTAVSGPRSTSDPASGAKLSEDVFLPVPNDVSRICISGGASQNLACILQVFSDPNVTKRIWMVAPCYFLACRIFEDAGFGGRLRAVREDEEGVDVGELERGLLGCAGEEQRGEPLKPRHPWSKTYTHIIYCVPTFSNPSGLTMSLRRRRQLVDLARKYDALVITDDVYDMLHWPVSPTSSNPSPPHALLPRLTDIDLSLPPHPSDPQRFHNTVSNGSFSKILAPGCRTGWAYSSPSFSYALSQAGSSRSGGCASQVTACTIALMLQNGSLQRHVKEVLVPGYQSRFRAMMRVLEQVLVPLGVRVPALHGSLTGADSKIGSVAGGYFIWFELPAGVGAKEVAARAREEENLIVANGELFEVFGDEEAMDLGRWMRVCFAWEDTESLVEGIERLGRVVERLLSEDKEGKGRVEGERKAKDVRDNLPGAGTY